MRVHFYLIPLFIILAISCNDSKDATDSKLPRFKENIPDIMQFFDIKENGSGINKLLFYNKNDSLPVRWISVTQEELQNSRVVNKKYFSVLVLRNPAESSVELFYKKNGKKATYMIEDKHFPDSIIFNQFNDTLLVCQYFWNYDFGSDLSNIRKYYFFGEKTGVFNYGYTSVDSPLNLEDFVIQDTGILLNYNEKKTTLLVRPDTLIHSELSKNEIIFKPNCIYFEKVVFSKLP
jgi:hypothetical protein